MLPLVSPIDALDFICLCFTLNLSAAGELTAQCAGPTRFDECNLIDNRNGTFTLIIKPMEAGKHILEVRYNNEHVLGWFGVLELYTFGCLNEYRGAI